MTAVPKRRSRCLHKVRQLLWNKLTVGETITIADERFSNILLVIKNHYSFTKKVGSGIKSFSISKNPYWHSKECVINRTDGSSVPISIMQDEPYIKITDQIQDHDHNTAMRRAVCDWSQKIYSFVTNYCRM
jgi:hypothetical protein